MQTGQSFQITITPDREVFCYVICYDSERSIFIMYDGKIQEGIELYTKPIMVDEPSGTETVYVIMSLSKLEKLENLITAFRANPNSRQHTNNLYREIVSMQQETSELGEPASAFISGGGTTRGESGFTRFSGKNMYVRVITIRH